LLPFQSAHGYFQFIEFGSHNGFVKSDSAAPMSLFAARVFPKLIHHHVSVGRHKTVRMRKDLRPETQGEQTLQLLEKQNRVADKKLGEERGNIAKGAAPEVMEYMPRAVWSDDRMSSLRASVEADHHPCALGAKVIGDQPLSFIAEGRSDNDASASHFS
jgi:hypothetical protein